MALIREETTHPIYDVELMVTQRYAPEVRDQWRIVTMTLNRFSNDLTPRELRDLGRWLVKEGKRIGREYKSNGAPKDKKEPT